MNNCFARFAIIGVGALLGFNSVAAIYYQDGFNYPAGSEMYTNSPWSNAVLNNTNLGIVTWTKSLTYTNGGAALQDFTPPGLACLETNYVSAGHWFVYDRFATNLYATNLVIYTSFLLNVQAGGGVATGQGNANCSILEMATTNSIANRGNGDDVGLGGGTTAWDMMYDAVNNHLGVEVCHANNLTTNWNVTANAYWADVTGWYSNTVVAANVTYFVVLKYAISNNSVSLYINPTPGAVEPTPNLVQYSGNAAFTSAYPLGMIGLVTANGNNQRPPTVIDSLRIGSTWADVTLATNTVTNGWVTLVNGSSFNSVSAFTNQWSYNYPWGTSHNGSALMNKTNVTVAGGVVNLTSSLTNTPNEGVSEAPFYVPIHYNSGTFYLTQPITINQQYPVWSVSAYLKVPTVVGTWPAFWLTGVTNWPPESDIAEFKGTSTVDQETYDGSWQTIYATIPSSGGYTGWHNYQVVATMLNSVNVDFKYYIDGALEADQTASTFVGSPLWLIIDYQMEASSGAPGPQYTTYYSISNVVVSYETELASQGPALWLNYDAAHEYLTNFDNPSTSSPCTETNAGGVTNSGAILVTGADGNATYTNGSWNFSAITAAISVSTMVKIQQATGTGDKIQLGLVNSASAGFSGAATGDGWIFGSFRLMPTSTTAPTYQLQCQTATNGTTSTVNVGSAVTLTVGHWYQFNTYFTNTGTGTSYNMASSLVDYGSTGGTQGSSVFTTSSTLETITGTQAALSSDSAVYPSFRVANDTGASVLDDFAVNTNGNAGGLPAVMSPPSPGGSAAPQFGSPMLANGKLTLTWGASGSLAQSAGTGQVTLLTATNLAGPWEIVTNASSPYVIPVNAGPQQFFRLQQ